VAIALLPQFQFASVKMTYHKLADASDFEAADALRFPQRRWTQRARELS
jgi:hypothetical protein